MGLGRILATLGNIDSSNYQYVELLQTSEWGHFVSSSTSCYLNADNYHDLLIGVEKIDGKVTGGVLISFGNSAFDLSITREIAGTILPSSFGSSLAYIGKLSNKSNRYFIIGDDEGDGWNGPGKIYIYSFDSPDEVKENKDPKLP